MYLPSDDVCFGTSCQTTAAALAAAAGRLQRFFFLTSCGCAVNR
jgi:hypothetical protein